MLGPLDEKAATLGDITPLPTLSCVRLTFTSGDLPISFRGYYSRKENYDLFRKTELELSRPCIRYIIFYLFADLVIYKDAYAAGANIVDEVEDVGGVLCKDNALPSCFLNINGSQWKV